MQKRQAPGCQKYAIIFQNRMPVEWPLSCQGSQRPAFPGSAVALFSPTILGLELSVSPVHESHCFLHQRWGVGVKNEDLRRCRQHYANTRRDAEKGCIWSAAIIAAFFLCDSVAVWTVPQKAAMNRRSPKGCQKIWPHARPHAPCPAGNNPSKYDIRGHCSNIIGQSRKRERAKTRNHARKRRHVGRIETATARVFSRFRSFAFSRFLSRAGGNETQ